MKQINSYLFLYEVSTQRSYDSLEQGKGFVEDFDTYGTCMITPLEKTQFIALLEFKEGVPRGNHYHSEKVEYITVLNGCLRCELYPTDQSEPKVELDLMAGAVLKILPGCVHVFTGVGCDTFALEYSPQIYDKSDVYRM